MVPLMIPLIIIYFHVVALGISVGSNLSIIFVGITIAILTPALVVGVAALERWLLRVFLGIDIPVPSIETEQSIWIRITQLVTDRRIWAAVVYLLSKFVVGVAVLALVKSLLATSVSLLFAPLYYEQSPVILVFGRLPPVEFTVTPRIMFGWDNLLIGLTATVQVDLWQITTFLDALLVAGLGVLLFALSLQLLNSLAYAWGQYAKIMLQTPRYWTDLA